MFPAVLKSLSEGTLVVTMEYFFWISFVNNGDKQIFIPPTIVMDWSLNLLVWLLSPVATRKILVSLFLR